MRNETDASLCEVRAHYPVGSWFRTIVGDRVRVEGYSQIETTGLYRLIVSYPPKHRRERIYPFNGHSRDDGSRIDPTPPQSVCENDTMQL